MGKTKQNVHIIKICQSACSLPISASINQLIREGINQNRKLWHLSFTATNILLEVFMIASNWWLVTSNAVNCHFCSCFISWEESSAEDSVDPVATSRVSRPTVRAAPTSAAAWSSVSSVEARAVRLPSLRQRTGWRTISILMFSISGDSMRD